MGSQVCYGIREAVEERARLVGCWMPICLEQHTDFQLTAPSCHLPTAPDTDHYEFSLENQVGLCCCAVDAVVSVVQQREPV